MAEKLGTGMIKIEKDGVVNVVAETAFRKVWESRGWKQADDDAEVSPREQDEDGRQDVDTPDAEARADQDPEGDADKGDDKGDGDKAQVDQTGENSGGKRTPPAKKTAKREGDSTPPGDSN